LIATLSRRRSFNPYQNRRRLSITELLIIAIREAGDFGISLPISCRADLIGSGCMGGREARCGADRPASIGAFVLSGSPFPRKGAKLTCRPVDDSSVERADLNRCLRAHLTQLRALRDYCRDEVRGDDGIAPFTVCNILADQKSDARKCSLLAPRRPVCQTKDTDTNRRR
jgi:hypothetical protein